MCDGSVQFVAEDAEHHVIFALASRSEGDGSEATPN